MSSTFAYGLGVIAGKRLTRIIVTSTLVPAPLLDGSQTRSPWAKALMRAVQKSPSMYRIMIHSAIKAWKVMGSRRMYLMQLEGFQPDVEAGQHPDAVAAYDHAMETMLSQGTEYAVISFEFASRDWTEWIENCEVPIELVQGRYDPSSSFDAVQAFATQHPGKITLTEISDAGYLTFLTHTDRMIDTLKAAVLRD